MGPTDPDFEQIGKTIPVQMNADPNFGNFRNKIIFCIFSNCKLFTDFGDFLGRPTDPTWKFRPPVEQGFFFSSP